MDWISDYEKEKRESEDAERSERRDREQSREEAISQFKPVKQRLVPIINTILKQLEARAAIKLAFCVDERSLEVRAIRPERGNWVDIKTYWLGQHRFTISEPTGDGRRVRVRAVNDDRHHVSAPAEGSEPAVEIDKGTAHVVLDVLTSLDLLASTDIHVLLRWLIETNRNKGPGVPEIEGQRRREEQLLAEREGELRRKAEVNNLKVVGWLAAVLGVGSCPALVIGEASGHTWLYFVTPGVAVLLGAWSLARLKSLGRASVAAIWGIGCGGVILLLVLAALWMNG